MIITSHIIERYAERVLKVEGNIKQYVANNRCMLIESVLSFINKAKFLHKNYVRHGEVHAKNVMINGQYVIIMSPHNKEAITLWSIYDKISSPEEFSEISSLIKKVRKNINKQEELQKVKKEQDANSRRLEGVLEWVETNKGTFKSIWANHHISELKSEISQSISKSLDLFNEIRDMRRENRDMMERILYGLSDSDRYVLHARKRMAIS